MSRLSSLSLCLLACAACDDAPVGADPEPEPSDLVCSEIVLENGRGAIARCPDGARFSWIVDGREVLTRVGPALVVGGVQLEADAWPTVTWSGGPDTDDAKQAVLSLGGRSDLARVETLIGLRSDTLVVEAFVFAETPLYLGAIVPVTAGLDTPRMALGLDGFLPSNQALARPGAQAWLTPSLISASARRPAAIDSDGRVEVPIEGEVAPGRAVSAYVQWTIDRLGVGFDAGPSRFEGVVPISPPWGWRTGAAHGAVVDPVAIAAERDVLLAHGDAPWIVVDGLWAPALGEASFDPGLIEATAGASLGLYWPAALVCPDAPAFDETANERRPSASACAELDPNLPAARDRVERARLALSAQGVAGFWLPDAAFADVVAPNAIAAPAESFPISLDRVPGAPGVACLGAALNGPFPRSPACEAALRVLDTAVDAPLTSPVEGARALMTHLDLNAVSPMPLTLAGPPSAARQRLVLAALGAGALLIADAPSAVPDAAWSWLAAVRARPDAFLASPRLTVDDWPPSAWDSDAARILFNFGDTPSTVTLDPEWIGTTDLFDPQIEATAEVSIPPHDVRVFVRPSR